MRQKNGLRNDTAKAISLLLISTGTRLPSTFILFAYQFTQKPGNCQPVTLWTVEKKWLHCKPIFSRKSEGSTDYRGLEKSKAKHMPVRDFWAKVSQPTPRPSLLDFAKAAVGVKVPAVEHLVAKASTAEALATMHVATRKRASAAKRIEGEQNAKARELKGARSALDLQLEVNQLRAKLAEYERSARGGRSCSGSTGNVSWLTLGNATATVTKSKPRKVRGFGECALLGGYALTRLLND